MSDYTKQTNFATKDSLPSGNAAKVIKGTEIDTEFNSIQTSIATKQDKFGNVTSDGTTVTVTGNLKVSDSLSTGSTSSLKIPSDTTTNRPTSPVVGMIRYNSTLGRYEGYDGSKWVRVQVQTDGNKGMVTTYNTGLDITGTYTQAGTTIEVTSNNHGVSVGETVYMTFSSGTAINKDFTVASVVDANKFTVTASDTQTTSGNVRVTGYFKINDNTITPSMLNSAFLIKAWVNFDGTVADNIGGTYSRSGTTVTITTTVNHGLIVGHKIYLDFTSGAATDGSFEVVSVTSPTVFTITHTASGTTSGNVTLNRRKINAGGNVSNVAYIGTGQYIVNFAVSLPDSFYATAGITTDSNNFISESARSANWNSFIVRNHDGTAQNGASVSLMMMR